MAYTYYRAITIDHTKCGSSANSTDFPALISGTYSYLKTVANGGLVQDSNGYDIAFYSDAALTTALVWEIERYVNTTGEVIFWVKIPTVSYTVDTVIYMAYGDNSISTFQSTATSVWDGYFRSVYHLPNGTSLTANDSTSNSSNGTLVNAPTAVSAQIGGGGNFSAGSLQYISVGAQNIGASFSLSMWVNFPTAGVFDFFSDRSPSYVANQLNFYVLADNKLGLYIQNAVVGSSSTLTPGAWNHIAVTFSANVANFWINGVKGGNLALVATPTYNASYPFWIGSQLYAGAPTSSYTGKMDEVKLSNIVRSDSWITSEYNNQNNPSTFYSVGSEVSLGAVNSGFFAFMNLIF